MAEEVSEGKNLFLQIRRDIRDREIRMMMNFNKTCPAVIINEILDFRGVQTELVSLEMEYDIHLARQRFYAHTIMLTNKFLTNPYTTIDELKLLDMEMEKNSIGVQVIVKRHQILEELRRYQRSLH